VTSPQAAALRDILNILKRRHQSANVLIFPAQVQGAEAASEVATGIRYFNKAGSVDVIIVARGGGSAEDLAAFNHEGLARTASASKIPLISAVGHETDFTILDFVADLRAPTPSTAAELVIRSRQEIEQQAESLDRRMEKAMRYRLLIARQNLTELAQHGAFARIMDLLHRRQQRLDDLVYRLAHSQRDIFEGKRRRFETLSAAVRHYDARRVLHGIGQQLNAQVSALNATVQTLLLRRRGQLEQLSGQLNALSPLAILDRGYALVFDRAGQLLKDASRVQSGDEIFARLRKGTVTATVKKKS